MLFFAFPIGVVADDIKFTDANIQELKASGRPALIYVWSQDQVYSMKHWQWFEAEARHQKMKFIAISKLPISKHSDFRGYSMPSKIFSTRNDSRYIESIGGLVHTPSVVIIYNGKIDSHPIVGLLRPDDLSAAIKKRKNAL